MMGKAIWRGCALVITGGIPSQLRGPRLGSLRSSRFSVIDVWENFRLNYPLPLCRYCWRRRRFPIFNSSRPAGSQVQRTIVYIVSINVYLIILCLNHHGDPRWHPDSFRL